MDKRKIIEYRIRYNCSEITAIMLMRKNGIL